MRKLLITLIMTLALALTFSLVVLADSVHNENTVDYSETVKLNNGTTVNLFDDEGNALIWYLDNAGALQSIRADAPQVYYKAAGYGVTIGDNTVGKVSGTEVIDIYILLDDGTKYGTGNFVVFNIMDDDVVTNTGSEKYMNLPVVCMKERFSNAKKLEYAYLRLDTIAIQKNNFNNCSNLKYINLEDLTELRRIGDGSNFSGCSSLFNGQILDLSKMLLISIDNAGSFNGVPMKGIIFPSTLKTISTWSFQGTAIESIAWPATVNKIESSMFKNNTALNTIYLSSSVGSIGQDAFLNVNTLEKVFFVGTLDELNTLLANVNATGNAPFLAVAGENNANVISYADYLALEDKSGNYMVYNYSWCEAYNGGKHEITGTNPCVGFCSVCENNIVKHVENAETTYKVVYENGFEYAGAKITTCTNEGCTHKVTEALPALFTNLGYTTPEYEDGGIGIKIVVDHEAISDYETLTGETVSYGMFIVTRKILGENDIVNENGEISSGVISLEMPKGKFDIMTMKLTGFDTDAQKSAEFAFGAYVIAGNKASYIQEGEKLDGDKYVFVSFNSTSASTDEE
jgi:hypothetical protein